MRSIAKVIFLLSCLSAGGVAAYFLQPFIHDNSDATSAIVTIMTVFAGFLIAIITIIGDPSMIPDGSWRTAEMHYDGIERRILIHLWLFAFYLFGIGTLFLGILIQSDDDVPCTIIIWIERTYLFFFVSSFLFTFALPASLWRLQMRRVDAEIARRRKAAGM